MISASSPAPRFLRRHRKFLLVSAVALALAAVAAGLWMAFGRSLLEAAWRDRPLENLGRWTPGSVDSLDLLARVFARRVLHVFVALVVIGYSLATLLYVLTRLRLAKAWIAVGVVGWYMAVEQIAPPFLERSLGLGFYTSVKDPDHWPNPATPGYNEDALRGARPRAAYGPDDYNVIFLGDSFTMGQWVRNVRQTFPLLVEEALRERFPELSVQVANFGWTSASPLLADRRLRAIGEEYHPRLVVLCVDMSDLHDDIKWQLQLEKRGLYWWFDKVPLTIRLIKGFAPELFGRLFFWSLPELPAQRFFAARASLEETRPFLEPIRRNIASLHQWCRAHEAEFVVFVLPRSFQYSDRECPRNPEVEFGEYENLGPWCLEPLRYFEELAAAVDHPIVSLLPDFQQTEVFPTCFEDDPHWNEAGHGVAAEAMVRHLGPLLEAAEK